MIFDDIDFTTYVKVENVRTSVLPPIRNAIKEIPGAWSVTQQSYFGTQTNRGRYKTYREYQEGS